MVPFPNCVIFNVVLTLMANKTFVPVSLFLLASTIDFMTGAHFLCLSAMEKNDTFLANGFIKQTLAAEDSGKALFFFLIKETDMISI